MSLNSNSITNRSVVSMNPSEPISETVSQQISDANESATETASSNNGMSGCESSLNRYNGFDENIQKNIHNLAMYFNNLSMNSKESFNNNTTTLTSPTSSDTSINNLDTVSTATTSASIFRVYTNGINPILDNNKLEQQTSNGTEVSTLYNPYIDPSNPQFKSKKWIQNMVNLINNDQSYYKPYELGCCWTDLCAMGSDTNDITYQTTVFNAPYKYARLFFNHLNSKRRSQAKKFKGVTILHKMDGLVESGELLVVLGRPGSGCTTLLKSLTGNTHGFKISQDSEITYNGISQKKIKKNYRGDVVYNAENDIHLPHLTVYQTLLTVARLKTPQNRFHNVSREQFADHITQVAMATYGLSHTRNTKVGNDLVRGVSGGERKRVSIAEVFICGSKFQCWDNATRGLDAATALEFVKALKTQASITNVSAAVSIYQCSKDAYDLFDKVCVLYEGYQIYFGTTTNAKKYFEKMGYYCIQRQTVADFITGITNPSERIINRNFIKAKKFVPQTPKEMNEYWENSKEYKHLIEDIEEYKVRQKANENEQIEKIREAHIAKQSKKARPASPYTVSYFMQVKYLLLRNFWRMKNSSSITLFQVCGNTAMSLIFGSMFYNVLKPPSTTQSFYYRGAAMFFAVLFNAFSSLLEIFAIYEAREITEKHRTYSLYHPSADALASILSELPPKIITCICFNIIYYFMVNFKRNGGNFFFYLLINFTSVLAMSHLFRTVGSMTKSLSEAMVPASILLLALSMYVGFAIPKTKLLGWSKWIWYINPLAYMFESLMVNEFHNTKFECATYIPTGPGYENILPDQRVCSVVGSVPGQNYVLGDDYLRESYDYYNKHKWRGFGIGLAYVIFFLGVYLLFCEINEGAKQKGEMLIFPHDVLKKMHKEGQIQDSSSLAMDSDLEKGNGNDSSLDVKNSSINNITDSISGNTLTEKQQLKGTNLTLEVQPTTNSSSNSSEKDIENNAVISKSESIFHWKNLCYDINIKGENRRILSNVDGWVKPGTLTALMGASGAGKTTLLDCLAERTTMGIVTGDMFVDGKLRDESFPRSIGYCQQQDLHLKTSTVRESLRFSAYLRQPYSVSRKEKELYVEEVIKILEMEKYAEAIVGVPGEGLNVEQRKRLTIGVELAAKPKLLLFLDEPTSGLDSQTAWSICKLMRKLANHGQAILFTIHQPSAILMQEFDRLLFLQKGGKTVYFGDLGKRCQTMIDYFEANGADKCPKEANPAEWMLDVVGAAPGSIANQDYYEVWRNSQEYRDVQEELNRLEEEFAGIEKPVGSEEHNEYATPLLFQIKYVVLRLFDQYWRSPTYLWSKFFLTIYNMLFIGFTFFKADLSLQGLQNQMLSLFMFTVIFNPLMQQYLPMFVQQRDLYEARERPSRTFSWITFIVSQILVEVPWNFLCGTIAYFIYYYSVGLYHNASVANQLHERGALFWLFSCAFFVFISSMSILVISFNEHDRNAANLGSLMFTMSLAFCGVMAGPDIFPRFWIFMYRVSPLTYFIDGLLSTGLANADVTCADYELVRFSPPSGMTCGEYMQPYISMAGTGYLTDTDATDTCHFCNVSKTNDFLKSVSSKYSRRWRNYGIFLCFIVFNFVAGIGLYWLARVPKQFRIGLFKRFKID
ncbi:hypothetical protein TBLA_0A02440 [Henningerozyma blattae CBS 6284]|uniref:ABC transporter domain-containing protein n=1 Tax=Henningerozyma blattae (strain ATCC 34711 / CBS 6284 / DSM 70876 / NBRC 10599 / NRRL Y-10934 / UCD 77-7) TaxID=1071380 RepID=I2GV91_HENB6|nr:hypothetical protein TBLA_0A02440 [Tetrapisispora blattae CBS 6284]CCH58043.1 hypothetical protein TBLA_0A02440 [Tetrapisispora blattae CBS 6284]